MKSSLAITLLICGTVLVTVPFLANLGYMGIVAGLLDDGGRVTLHGELPSEAYWAPIVIGTLMILVGVGASCFKRRQ
jgi:hypothetical protein